MKSTELKNELTIKLIDACKNYMSQAQDGLCGQSVFSFVIYCSSGCNNMGIALCTREGLENKNKELIKANVPTWYAEVNAAEWDHINEYYQLFDDVDEFIEKLYETFYEGTLDDVNLDGFDSDDLWQFISNFFIGSVVDSVNELKMTGFFNNPIFENDLLLGMQFGDPDSYSIDMIEQSSLKLNSDFWHHKIKQNCDLIRKNL